MSRAPPPCYARMFLLPRVVPWRTGLCLNPSSSTAPRRRAETHGAQGRGGTADVDVGAVLVPSHAAEHGGGCRSCCQCILLPTAASCSSPAAPWGEGAEPVRVRVPGGATSPGHPPLLFTWGFLAAGTCRSTSCSRPFGDVGSLPWLRPALNRPLPERKPWGGRRGRAGRGWQPPRPPPTTRDVPTAPLQPASGQLGENAPPRSVLGRDPAPCERCRHLGAAPSPPPCSSPTSQQPSAFRVPRDAQWGRPSPRIHNSISLSRLDGQTDRNSPSPRCPPSARRQLLPPAHGRRRWVFIHK